MGSGRETYEEIVARPSSLSFQHSGRDAASCVNPPHSQFVADGLKLVVPRGIRFVAIAGCFDATVPKRRLQIAWLLDLFLGSGVEASTWRTRS